MFLTMAVKNGRFAWSYPPGRRDSCKGPLAIVLMNGNDKREINAGPYDLAVVSIHARQRCLGSYG